MESDIAFIQVRDELRSHTARRKRRYCYQDDSSRYHRGPKLQRGIEDRGIKPPCPAHQTAVLFRNLSGYEHRDGRRNEGEGQKEGSRQSHDDGNSHRMEHLSLDAGQGEDGHIDEGDDRHTEQGRPYDLACSGCRKRESLVTVEQTPEAVLSLAQSPQTVLDDNDGAIHNEPEIERTETHQVARNLRLDHAGDRQQHGEGNDGGGDQCRPDIPEQQKEDHDDEQCPFQKVLFNRPDRPFDEVRAVVDRHGLDAGGQRFRRLRKTFGRGAGHDAAVLSRQHEYRSEDHLAAVLGCRPRSQFLACCDIGNIRYADRRSRTIDDDDLLQIFYRRRLTGNADQILFAVAFHITRTDIGVVLLKRAYNFGHREAVC